jgi:hypothetical protein
MCCESQVVKYYNDTRSLLLELNLCGLLHWCSSLRILNNTSLHLHIGVTYVPSSIPYINFINRTTQRYVWSYKFVIEYLHVCCSSYALNRCGHIDPRSCASCEVAVIQRLKFAGKKKSRKEEERGDMAMHKLKRCRKRCPYNHLNTPFPCHTFFFVFGMGSLLGHKYLLQRGFKT